VTRRTPGIVHRQVPLLRVTVREAPGPRRSTSTKPPRRTQPNLHPGHDRRPCRVAAGTALPDTRSPAAPWPAPSGRSPAQRLTRLERQQPRPMRIARGPIATAVAGHHECRPSVDDTPLAVHQRVDAVIRWVRADEPVRVARGRRQPRPGTGRTRLCRPIATKKAGLDPRQSTTAVPAPRQRSVGVHSEHSHGHRQPPAPGEPPHLLGCPSGTCAGPPRPSLGGSGEGHSDFAVREADQVVPKRRRHRPVPGPRRVPLGGLHQPHGGVAWAGNRCARGSDLEIAAGRTAAWRPARSDHNGGDSRLLEIGTGPPSGPLVGFGWVLVGLEHFGLIGRLSGSGFSGPR